MIALSYFDLGKWAIVYGQYIYPYVWTMVDGQYVPLRVDNGRWSVCTSMCGQWSMVSMYPYVWTMVDGQYVPLRAGNS